MCVCVGGGENRRGGRGRRGGIGEEEGEGGGIGEEEEGERMKRNKVKDYYKLWSSYL